jgi:predicted nucleic acid-binding protein
MQAGKRVLTLDSSVFVCALKPDERHSAKCREIIGKVPRAFVLSEPSIVYQEVCGTVARRVGTSTAGIVKDSLDGMIHPGVLLSCDRSLCVSVYPLRGEFGIYAVDALYLKTAIDTSGILLSLDEDDFLRKVKTNRYGIEAYHPSDFPY